jgi:hypothetical protein
MNWFKATRIQVTSLISDVPKQCTSQGFAGSRPDAGSDAAAGLSAVLVPA